VLLDERAVTHRAAGRLGGVVIGAAVLVLSGCAVTSEPRPTPSVVETPAIVWRDGVEPSSPLEQNKFVMFLRARVLGEAVAWNTGDFTIEQLISTTTSSRVKTLVSDYEAQHVVQWKFLGPVPFQPIRVEETPDGRSAKVFLCQGADADWQLRTAGVVNDAPLANARVAELSTSATGRLFVASGWSTTDESCDGVQVTVASFDPPVMVPEDPFAHPIEGVKRAPLKWQLDELKRTVG
jgi:hypothetical protein